MSINAIGMYLIPASSWSRAQKPPGVRFRMGCVVVVEYYAECLGIWMLRVMMREENIESDDERIVCHVACEAKCRETMMNYAKKYSGVPLKRASLSGKS